MSQVISPTTPIDEALTAIAAKQPTPGGGAVAAMSGALAAAIGEMSLNYSIGRKETAQYDAALTTVVDELTRAREMMLELMVEDQQAFAEFTETKKLDPSDPVRTARAAASVEKCIAVPRAIAATALQMLRLIEPIVDKSNRWLLSDLAVSVDLAMATLRVAQHSVKVNLPEVDAQRRVHLQASCEAELRAGVELVTRIMPRIYAILQPR